MRPIGATDKVPRKPRKEMTPAEKQQQQQRAKATKEKNKQQKMRPRGSDQPVNSLLPTVKSQLQLVSR